MDQVNLLYRQNRIKFSFPQCIFPIQTVFKYHAHAFPKCTLRAATAGFTLSRRAAFAQTEKTQKVHGAPEVVHPGATTSGGPFRIPGRGTPRRNGPPGKQEAPGALEALAIFQSPGGSEAWRGHGAKRAPGRGVG